MQINLVQIMNGGLKMVMNKILLTVTAVIFLSGCAAIKESRMDEYNRGWWNGKTMCEEGKKSPERSYKKGFYAGFLFENLRKVEK